MSPKAKNITARVLVRALEKDGYVFKRKTRGGHRIYKHPCTGRRVGVPYHHSGKSFCPGTLDALITAAGWNDDDLSRLGLNRKGRGR